MAQPTYDWNSGGLTADHDPTANEPWDQGIIQYMMPWRNSTNGKVWYCTSAPYVSYGDPLINTDLTWKYWLTESSSAPSAIPYLNTTRQYQPVTLAFNTSRTPSTTNDVYVKVIVGTSSALIGPAVVLLQTNDTGTFVTLDEDSISGVVESDFASVSGIIPVNVSYKIIDNSSGAGSVTIVSIKELLL